MCGPAETTNGNLFYTAPSATQIAEVNVFYGSFQLSGFPIPLLRSVVAVNGNEKEVKWQVGASGRPQAEPEGLCSRPGPSSNKLGDLDP